MCKNFRLAQQTSNTSHLTLGDLLEGSILQENITGLHDTGNFILILSKDFVQSNVTLPIGWYIPIILTHLGGLYYGTVDPTAALPIRDITKLTRDMALQCHKAVPIARRKVMTFSPKLMVANTGYKLIRQGWDNSSESRDTYFEDMSELKLAQQHNPYLDDVHTQTQSIMNEIVHITGLLRDFNATGLKKFNTPNAKAYTPLGEAQMYNSGCFLKSDPKLPKGKTPKPSDNIEFKVMPISGKATTDKGGVAIDQNNHEIIAELWSKYVTYLSEVHAKSVSGYTGFYGVTDKNMLIEAHYSHLSTVLSDILDIESESESFFNEVESWLRKIPTPNGYGNYYLFGFNLKYVKDCIAAIVDRTSKILYAILPFVTSSKDSEKINKKLMKDNTNLVNTQQTTTTTNTT